MMGLPVTTLIRTSTGRRTLACMAAALGLVTFAGCGETSANAPLPAARVEAVDAPLSAALPERSCPTPVEVRVFGSDDQPLPGTTVTFSVSGGGSVDPASATSDDDGIASTRWTLGQAAGGERPDRHRRRAGSRPRSTRPHRGPPRIRSAVAGNNQTAAAGSPVAIPPGVRVVDAFGNVAADELVSFSVVSGGGSVTNGLRQTNAQGVATVGSWILGPSTGTQTLAAGSKRSGVDNNPVIFTATATTPTGSQLVITAGNNQTAPVGRLVPVAPTVAFEMARATECLA